MTPHDTIQFPDELPGEVPGEVPCEVPAEGPEKDTAEAQVNAQTDAAGEAADAPSGAAAGDAEPEQLVALLEDARAKADGHWDQLLRTRAEMENLRRRQARELENAHKFALEGFVRELLQVRDSLELGQEAAGAAGADVDKLREGMTLTLKLLADTMAKFGVEVIDPQGQPFNPELHQAMTLVPREDLAPNTVAGVVQRGYLLNGRLVRPAMVMVSRIP